jgi:hypothetical protein
VPGRVEADQESPCSATAMRKFKRRMTQLYDALAPAGLHTTQYAILKELDRPAALPVELATVIGLSDLNGVNPLLLMQGYSNEDKHRMIRPPPIEIDGSERRALG